MQCNDRQAIAHERRQVPLLDEIRTYCARQLARVEAGGETLQRMPRGNLCLAPFVDVAAKTCMLNAPRLGAFGLQMIQSSVIDGLERQAVLKPLDGRSIERASRL